MSVTIKIRPLKADSGRSRARARAWLPRVGRWLGWGVLAIAALTGIFGMTLGLFALFAGASATAEAQVPSRDMLTLLLKDAPHLQLTILASVGTLAGSAAFLVALGLLTTMTASAHRVSETLGDAAREPKPDAGLPNSRALYQLVYALYERVQALEERIRELGGEKLAPTPPPILPESADTIPAPAPEERAGLEAREKHEVASREPRRDSGGVFLGDEYFEDDKPARAPGVAPRAYGRAVASSDQASSSVVEPPVETASDTLASIARIEASVELQSFMRSYQQAIAAPASLGAFEAKHKFLVVDRDGQGGLISAATADAPFWFLAAGDFGLLLPSKAAVISWQTSFQAAGGMRAKNVFRDAYDVRSGSVLDVSRPAWASRRGSEFTVLQKGALSGA